MSYTKVVTDEGSGIATQWKWRDVVLDLVDAQRTYDEIVIQAEASNELFSQAWLRLWRAERRCDEFLRAGI
jgi:hypothetical protein